MCAKAKSTAVSGMSRSLYHSRRIVVKEVTSSAGLKAIEGEGLGLGSIPGIPVISDTILALDSQKYIQTLKANKEAGKTWGNLALGVNSVHVHDPSVVLEVQVNEHDLVTPVNPKFALQYLVPNTILMAGLPEHKLMRAAYFKALSPAALACYVPATYATVKGNLERLAKEGRPLQRMHSQTAALSFALMCGRVDPENGEIAAAVMQKAVQWLLFPMVNLPFFKPKKALLEENDKMVQWVRPYVNEALERGAEGGGLSSAMIVNLAREYEKLGLPVNPDTWLCVVCGNFWFNNASVPTLTLYMCAVMGRYPKVVRKLRDEQARVEAKYGDELTWQALGECEYGMRFVKEVLRVMPPEMFVPRLAKKNINLNGYYVRKGALIYLQPNGHVRVPEWEATEHVFDPDRWLDNPAPATYKPFGDGPRTCVASAVGIMQLRVYAWELARSYAVEGAHVGKGFNEVGIEDTLRLVKNAKVC